MSGLGRRIDTSGPEGEERIQRHYGSMSRRALARELRQRVVPTGETAQSNDQVLMLSLLLRNQGVIMAVMAEILERPDGT